MNHFKSLREALSSQDWDYRPIQSQISYNVHLTSWNSLHQCRSYYDRYDLPHDSNRIYSDTNRG